MNLPWWIALPHMIGAAIIIIAVLLGLGLSEVIKWVAS